MRRHGIKRLAPPPQLAAEEIALFRAAVADTRPLLPDDRIHHEPPRPKPVVGRHRRTDDGALPSGLQDRPDDGDEATWLHNGLSRQALKDLRRKRWPIGMELDLHGLTRDEARSALVVFLAEGVEQGWRCVRIIHGKGMRSPGTSGVLRTLVRGWLRQRPEVLAYCQAQPQDGGEGALLALLRNPQQRP